MTTFYSLAFTLGGAGNGHYELFPGDIIWCSSRTYSALVIDVSTNSGTWASGTAAGVITMQVIYGSWTASQYFDSDCAGSNTAYISSLTAISSPPMLPGLLSTPTVSHANYGKYLTSIQVKRALTDKVYSASLGFDKLLVAGATSLIYWKRLMIWIPDYSGTYRLVFLGVAPSSNTDYQAYGGEETLMAYSYDLYLAKQPLDPNLVSMPWQSGIQTMTPATFGTGCIGEALVFAGTQWLPTAPWLPYMTGLHPFGIYEPTGWDSTMTAIPFVFTPKTTKQAALDEICGYTNQLNYCRWMLMSIDSAPTEWAPSAFMVNYADIDDPALGIFLPSPLYMTNGINLADDPTNGNPYLLAPVKLDQKGEDVYNFFVVRGQFPSGVWFQTQYWVDNVFDQTYNPSGTIIKLAYYEENKNITNPTDAYLRAVAISQYYSHQVMTWSCTLRQRSDLVLYQRVIISGYSQIASGTYRIIDITYDLSASENEIVNEVAISIILDSDFKAYLGTMRVFVNPVQEIRNVTENVNAQSVQPISGTLASISRWKPQVTVSRSAAANYVIALNELGLAPTFSMGATATITGLAGSGMSWNVEVDIGGTRYWGTCQRGGSLSLGWTGTVTALNAQVTFSITDLGSGQSYTQIGYTSNSSALSVGTNVVATPDQNGKYVVAAT